MIELLVAQPINTEAELLRLYPLPVLARVPEDDLDSGARFRRPLSDAPPSVREGFRALRDQLELRASSASSRPTGEWGPTVLMVSPERSDARSACTLDLARAFSSIHDSATVLELDVRNPRMAGMLAVDPPGDLSSLLSGGSVGAVGVPFDGAGSRLVAAPPVVDLATHEAITARSASIVAEARQRDGWVVVDAPPITEATADAVAALQAADHVVVIVHLGSTRPEGLSLLREVFEQRGRRPDGYLVVSGNLVRERRSASPS
jgi:Mrp family chromosome partitioning ATPase